MANILSLPKEEGGDDGEIKMSRIKFKKKTSPASFVDLVAGLRGEPFGKHTHTNPSG